MNGSPLTECGHEVPRVGGRFVRFRPSARIALRTRRPRFMPGVLIRLDERRIPRRGPGLCSKIKWSVVGSGATLLLLLFVKLILPPGARREQGDST